MASTPNIIDRSTLLHHRARFGQDVSPFLHEDAAFEISERLSEIKKSFTETVLVGHATRPLRDRFPDARTIADNDRLELEPHTLDLAIHSFGLHWANDPIGQIVQCRLALKPDGLFIGVLFGGKTLNEFRSAIAEAETQLVGGLSPRILPMGDIRDLGALVGRAGLALPVADTRRVTVRYPSLKRLVQDLREMGETNAMIARHRKFPPRALFDQTERIYRQHFSDSEGFLIATFEMVYLTGWAPSETQQKPLRPGSAKTRLAHALGVREQLSGETAIPDDD